MLPTAVGTQSTQSTELNAQDHKDQDPCTSLTSAVQKELAKQEVHADDNACKYQNKTPEALQAKTTRDLLRAEKAHIYNVAHTMASRVPQQKVHAVTKALKKAQAVPNERHMKKKGIVQDECQEMLRDLQTLNVPVEKLNEVVHVVGRGFGLEIKDNVSMWTT
jgi:hypothetical protein